MSIVFSVFERAELPDQITSQTSEGKLNLRFRFPYRLSVFRQDLVNKSVNIRRLRTLGYPENRHQSYY